jgi:formate hydrogenlyase subunit 3/multisubunit Na+/H+ antiporter MnhD subunit
MFGCLIRFLPLEVALPDWGMSLMVLGLLTAYYGVIVGVTQQHPKTVLAYSTVSQMGVVAAVLGAGLSTGAPGTGALAAFYALHHLLVKGALFLGVGIVGATGTRYGSRVIIPMALLAFSLAGLPLTSGALAKFATKPLFGDGLAAFMATLSAAGSALLMAHFLGRLRMLANENTGAVPQVSLGFAWALVAAASLILPWVLFPEITTYALSETVSMKALWVASWPIAMGLLMALLMKRIDSSIPRIPEGDIIVLLERLQPLAARFGTALERTDLVLRLWPVAGIVLLTLAIAFGTALQFAR